MHTVALDKGALLHRVHVYVCIIIILYVEVFWLFGCMLIIFGVFAHFIFFSFSVPYLLHDRNAMH